MRLAAIPVFLLVLLGSIPARGDMVAIRRKPTTCVSKRVNDLCGEGGRGHCERGPCGPDRAPDECLVCVDGPPRADLDPGLRPRDDEPSGMRWPEILVSVLACGVAVSVVLFRRKPRE